MLGCICLLLNVEDWQAKYVGDLYEHGMVNG